MSWKPWDMSSIQQLDGNVSFSESENSLITSPPPTLHDKISDAAYLPAIASYNMRSLFPKIGNVKNDLIERGISLGFFSEIWQKLENKSHKFEIESMLEGEGLKYISTARPSG